MTKAIPASVVAVLRCIAGIFLAILWFYGMARFGLVEQLLANPVAAFSYTGIFVLYLCSAPARIEAGFVMVCATVIRLAIRGHAQAFDGFPFAPVVPVTALMGYVSVGTLIVRWSVGKQPRKALEMLVRVLIFVVLGVAIGWIVEVASYLRPVKLDLFLYSLERAYGLPSFVVGRWFTALPSLTSIELLIYYSLPLALAATYAMHLKRPQPGVDVLLALYINALVGFSLYILYPACGPLYVFHNDFPSFAPVIGDLGISPLVMDCRPNAMPSLHIAGALLIFWNLRPFGRIRFAAFAYLILTVLATLGFGEHYFVDLVVALPYALAVQALATDSRYKIHVTLLGAAGVVLWMMLFRYAIPLLVSSPPMLWLITVATLVVTAFGRRLLISEPRALPIGGRLGLEAAN
jgi:hypothetical protein